MMIWVWDVPILIILGMILARIHAKWFAIKHPNFFFFSAVFITALFWINSLVSAFGGPSWLGVESTYRVPGWIALFFVLSYPTWLLFGAERMFALFGRRPTQGGFMWPFSIKETTKPFESPWKKSDP